jgi:hypothetical protein
MRPTEQIPQTPVSFRRTTRPAQSRVLTSADAGKIIPLRMEPVLREEVVSGRVGVTVEMAETPEVVSNAVHGKLQTWFVPYLAMEQFFGSLEEFNRRYMKEDSLLDMSNAPGVQPFFNKNTFYGATEELYSLPIENDANAIAAGVKSFYDIMGIHLPKTGEINSSYVQAYNCVVNHRRKARSPQLALRNEFDHRLAECFWPTAGMTRIVAAYDDKLIAGEVKLRDLTFKAPVGVDTFPGTDTGMRIVDNSGGDGTLGGMLNASLGGNQQVWAELTTGSNATMNLADIDQARKTAAFAKLRTLYSGQTDDYIIDMLMQGLSVPLEMMKDPMLVGRSEGTFNFNQRYATDAANLDASATRGLLSLNHRVSVPQTTTGGILVTTLEIAPERVWERAKDHYMHMTDPAQFPNALVDYLDPEKVTVATKDEFDVNHSTPTQVFGYRPKNDEWRRNDVRVGGRFIRPDDDAYKEDRARIWAAEAVDPALNTDFYLVTNLPKKVFADQASDGFEILAMQDLKISTNIQFGDNLLETDGSSDYDYITAQVDADQGTPTA